MKTSFYSNFCIFGHEEAGLTREGGKGGFHPGPNFFGGLDIFSSDIIFEGEMSLLQNRYFRRGSMKNRAFTFLKLLFSSGSGFSLDGPAKKRFDYCLAILMSFNECSKCFKERWKTAK